MLIQRIISTLLWVVILWLVIFVFPVWVFMLAITFLIAIALKEFYNMAKEKGFSSHAYMGIVAGCILPWISCISTTRIFSDMEFLLLLVVSLVVFILQIFKRKTENALLSIATTIFGIFYIAWLASFIVKIRFLQLDGADGRFLVLYLLIVTKSSDVGAYLVGTFFGKHPMIPHVSPKKSVEGTIAGFIVSFSAAIIFGAMLPFMGIIKLALLGIILGLLSQLGDWSESVLKRDCKIKDSGKVFPGFGGILDIVDSLLFAIPVFYFYIVFFG
ncbi:MAG: phosphatidate cytidylyltransferase [Candidatus Omnitrophota bacterium]